MENCHGVSTSMLNNFDYSLLVREKSESAELENLCRQIIGSIMYLMLCSRPDLCAAISILSRFQNCASAELLTHLKRVLMYIKYTLDLGLTFVKCTDAAVISAFVDDDFAGDKIDCKSTSGFCFKIFNCTVSRCTKKTGKRISVLNRSRIRLIESLCL